MTLRFAATLDWPAVSRAPHKTMVMAGCEQQRIRITGDITLSDLKITIGFKAFPIASIRDLKPAEVSAVFDADVNTAVPARSTG